MSEPVDIERVSSNQESAHTREHSRVEYKMVPFTKDLATYENVIDAKRFGQIAPIEAGGYL